jgi:hypothetical protein
MTKTTTTSLMLLTAALLLAAGATAGQQRTEIVATDDWPIDSGLSLGKIYCPGGEVVLDPFTGLPGCTPGSRTHLRDADSYSCIQAFTAAGEPEPRITGVGFASTNANFDAGYTGAVWGTWMIVPTETCDLSALDDPEVYWIGTWRGQRTAVCDAGGPCLWIGNLRFVGRGRGGDLQGLHFRGTELILTYTPFPLPYELLPLLGLCQPGSCPTGAEGHLTGTIQ